MSGRGGAATTRPTPEFRRAAWALLGVAVVALSAAVAAALPAPSTTSPSATPWVPFVDGRPFCIAFRRSTGTWGATAGITINAKIRQQIGAAMVDTTWTQVSLRRYDAGRTLGVVLTARRGAGSTPPLYGSLLTSIIDNGTGVPCGSISVTELPTFDPCPP